MSSFWRSFWTSKWTSLPSKWPQKWGPKWHQKWSKKWPKKVTFWPFLGHFLDPLFSGTCWICQGGGPKYWGTTKRGSKRRSKSDPKCVKKGHFLDHLLDTFIRSGLMIWTKKGVQKVTQKGHFWGSFWTSILTPFWWYMLDMPGIRHQVLRYLFRRCPKGDQKWPKKWQNTTFVSKSVKKW